MNGFNFTIAANVEDGTMIPVLVTSTNGQDTWENTIVITAGKAAFEYTGYAWKGSYTPGETFNVSASFHNIGHFQSTGAIITASSDNQYLTINNPEIEYGVIAIDGTATVYFSVTISASCPSGRTMTVKIRL